MTISTKTNAKLGLLLLSIGDTYNNMQTTLGELIVSLNIGGGTIRDKGAPHSARCLLVVLVYTSNHWPGYYV